MIGIAGKLLSKERAVCWREIAKNCMYGFWHCMRGSVYEKRGTPNVRNDTKRRDLPDSKGRYGASGIRL